MSKGSLLHMDHVQRIVAVGRPHPRRFSLLAAVLLIAFLYFSASLWNRTTLPQPEPLLNVDGRPVLPLPAAYTEPSRIVEYPGQCRDRYGSNYLRAFSNSATQYSVNGSVSDLTCFTHKSHDARTDSFCIGSPATFDSGSEKFHLDCALQDGGEANDAPKLSDFPTYWDGAGSGPVLRDQVEFTPGTLASTRPRRFSFLVKREAGVHNLWHMMMEIISFTLSIDVLRITINPRTGLPYFTDHDIPHSQVVFIDNFAEGPLWDLYGIATGIPPVRLSHLTMHEPTTIVTPLPGASNPFWHGHWNGIDCGESILMRTFARRVLAFHNLTAAAPAWREAEPFRLTILNRTRTRRLLHLAEYVAALRDRHPDVAITVVDDAATLPFAQQLRIAHSSDILVGAHGAGLTHGMFLRPGSTLVELLPHGLPNFQGFRNVAHFMGLRYLDGHGVEYEAAEKTGDWYRDDVFMEKDRFLELMDLAIGKWST